MCKADTVSARTIVLCALLSCLPPMPPAVPIISVSARLQSISPPLLPLQAVILVKQDRKKHVLCVLHVDRGMQKTVFIGMWTCKLEGSLQHAHDWLLVS